jgi:ubiquinone/menaquinone biosynthesis C-methylase UbiE
MEVINPFEIEGEAKRYHTYRPRYHHIPLREVRNYVGNDFVASLDVACGTGHATDAISRISKKTVGCDLSESMLREARSHFPLEFVKANAESLPFADSTFDFVSISMAFHWVNQEKFLTEARRVLMPGGYLAIDNYGFVGAVSADSAKQGAHRQLLEQYLPAASRLPGHPNEDLANKAKMKMVKEITYEHVMSLNSHEFTNLLMTWSNFQILSEAQKPITSQKMKQVYDMIFEDENLELKFGGKTLLYQFRI